MLGLSIWKLLIILVIVLIIFGGNRLPKIGQGLGDMVREFKKAPRARPDDPDDSDRPDSPAERSKPGLTRDDLSDLKDLAQLGTRTGRRNLLGRFFGKRF